MRILSIRPEPPGFGNAKTIARFDVEVNEHLRIYNIGLRQIDDGTRRVCAPNAYGKHSATFSPELAKLLAKLASEAYKPYEYSHAA